MLPEDLVLNLSDANAVVRLKAVAVLGDMEDADALACLVEALTDRDVSVCCAAHQALCRKSGVDFGYDRESWLIWWIAPSGDG